MKSEKAFGNGRWAVVAVAKVFAVVIKVLYQVQYCTTGIPGTVRTVHASGRYYWMRHARGKLHELVTKRPIYSRLGYK